MWLPMALVALITVVDVFVPRSVHLGPLLVAPPTLAAALSGPLVTAAVGVLAVACQLLLGVLREETGTSNTTVQVCALAAAAVGLTLYSRSRGRRERELRKARLVAHTASTVLLRKVPPRMGPLRLATEYRAADAEARLGGDFFGAMRRADGTRLLIGDVRGKGLYALDDTALILGAFRAAGHLDLPLAELAAHLDSAVTWSNSEKKAPEDFATALLVDIPDTGAELSVVCCGHPAPYALREGTVRPLESSRPAPPLGLGGFTPGAWEVERHAFAPGETLVLYTDGVIEARDRSGTFYPLPERLPLLNPCATPEQLVHALVEDLLRHTAGHLDDDTALLTVRRSAPEEAAADGRAGE